jgi:hypothetical protein
MKAHTMLSIACAAIACIAIGCSSEVPTASESATNSGSPAAFYAPVPTPVPDGEPVAPAPVEGETSWSRSIEEFLKEQGTYCIDDGSGGCRLFAPRIANYLAWFDPGHDRTIAVDYAGLVKAWLESHGRDAFGAHISGSIMEQLQPDGRSMITVDLHMMNATSFMVQGPELQSPAIFGTYPMELMHAPNHPALGDVHMHLVFMNFEPRMSMPDLVQLVTAPKPGQEILDFQFHYDGRWMLQDGSMQHVRVSRAGPFQPAFPTPGPFAPMGIATIDWMKQ